MSDKKTPPPRRGLMVGNFGSSDNIPFSSAPIGVTSAQIAVDRISFFDGNPRRAPNPRYEEIKESIRATGLDHPLPVSQRPTDLPGHYIIYKGGNTRLRALKELWAETRDKRFFEIRCEFHPFVSETDALISHLRENDLRGDMTFIDRALAVQEAKRQLEAEQGDSLSLRKLETAFKERGFPISISMISRLEYGAKLNTAIPKALQFGLGEPQIRKLRQLEKASCKVWQFHCNPDGSEEQFRAAVFLPAIASSDGESWVYDAAESLVMEKLLAVLPSGVNPQTVQLDFNRVMDGKEPMNKSSLTAPESDTAPQSLVAVANQQTGMATPSPVAANAGQAPLEPAYDPLDQYDLLNTGGTSNEDMPVAWQPDNGIRIQNPVAAIPQREVIIDGNGQWLDRLKQLRLRNHAVAMRLAHSSPIPKAAKAIVAIETGYGFFLRDVFNPDFIATLVNKQNGDLACTEEERMNATRHYVEAANLWWLLAEVCGLFPDTEEQWISAPDSIKDSLIEADSFLRDSELLHAIHPLVAVSNHMRTFWLAIPTSQAELVFELIRNTVAIINLVLEHRSQTNDATPWEVVTGAY